MPRSALWVMLAALLVACGGPENDPFLARQTRTAAFDQAVGTAAAARAGTAVVETVAALPTGTPWPHMLLPTLEPSPTPPLPPFPFVVYADRPWQDTGAYIREGDLLQIDYTAGQWTSKTGQDYTGPDNAPLPAERDYACAPLPASMVGRHALIARIGDGSPFKVGAQFVGAASDEGPLFLQMNDCDERRVDNDGAITVIIHVRR
jgi:hypothetical protein